MNISHPTSVLVCLHGWGGSKESFTELRDALKNDPITVLTPDLPGFGAEPEPKEPWTNDDYANWVEAWVTAELLAICHQPSALLLLGHSHGGRIAIKLATRKSASHEPQAMSHLPITHLFLCASAGIRHARHIRRIIGLILAKFGKVLVSIPGLTVLAPLGKKFLYKLIRVHDYEKASEVMRKTLINVTQENLRPLLSTIEIPTDIFWGTDDSMTPYSDALIMNREIKSSTLHTYPGIRHKVHRERAKEIAEIIRKDILSSHP